MAGTHNITQTRPSYICQSITSTGPGESALNALETISVASIAEDAIATVASTGDFYEWSPSSVAAPGVGVVIPLGQALITPGRWIKLTSLPVGVVYNQFIEGLPLAATLAPEYGALVAALQQPTLRFTNGNVSDGAGHTDVTLEYQQVWSEDSLGAKAALPPRARIRFAASQAASSVPVVVTDEAATDTTLVTLHPSSGTGLTKIIDLSLQPYALIPNNYAAAAWNTAQLQLAITAAIASNNGSILYLPAGIYYVAKNAAGPDLSGLTYAVPLLGGPAPSYYPVILVGDGPTNSILRYASSGGDYDCVVHRPEGVSAATETQYQNIEFRGIGIRADDDVSGHNARFCLKIRGCTMFIIDNVNANNGSECNIAIDYSYDGQLTNVFAGYGKIGIATGAFDGGVNNVLVQNCRVNYCTTTGFYFRNTDGLVQNCSSQYNPGVGVIISNVESLDVRMYYEVNASVGTVISGVTYKSDVILFRGDVDKTNPLAWVWTWNDTSDGHTVVDEQYRNSGVVLRGVPTSPGISAFAIGNAYDGVVFTEVIRDVGAGAPVPVLMYLADGTSKGILMPFSMDGTCRRVTAPVPYTGTTVVFGATNLATVANSKVAGVPIKNLLGPDILGDLDTRFDAGLGGGDGSLIYSTTQTYEGRPVLQFVGASRPTSIGKIIDSTANPELAGKTLVVAARCYDDGLGNKVEMSISTSSNVAGGLEPPTGVAGWRVQCGVFTMPAASQVTVGYTKLGTAPAVALDLAVFELGAGYEDVVAATWAQSPARMTALRHSYQVVKTAQTFSANGAVTIAGVTATVTNKANVTLLAVGPGAGLGMLFFSGVQAAALFGAGGQLAPALEYILANFIPNYQVGMSIWVEAILSGISYVGANDGAITGYYSGNLSTTGAGAVEYLGVNTAGTLEAARCKYVASGAANQVESTLIFSAPRLTDMQIQSEVPGQGVPRTFVSQNAGALPSITVVPGTQQAISGATGNGACMGVTSAGMRVLVGGEHGGNWGFAQLSFGWKI